MLMFPTLTISDHWIVSTLQSWLVKIFTPPLRISAKRKLHRNYYANMHTLEYLHSL